MTRYEPPQLHLDGDYTKIFWSRGERPLILLQEWIAHVVVRDVVLNIWLHDELYSYVQSCRRSWS